MLRASHHMTTPMQEEGVAKSHPRYDVALMKQYAAPSSARHLDWVGGEPPPPSPTLVHDATRRCACMHACS